MISTADICMPAVFLIIKKERIDNMGGRGGMSGNIANSEYQSAYKTEIANLKDFNGSFIADLNIQSKNDRNSIADYMRMNKEITGKSLISEMENEITNLKQSYAEVSRDMENSRKFFGKNADNSRNSELGMKAGIKDKIKIREKIIKNMR